MSTTKAMVIKIDDRYFCKVSPRTGNIMTAWSLAGAKLFLPNSEELEKKVNLLRSRNKPTQVIWVST